MFSKRAWAVPIRTKSGRDVTEAFERVLDERQCNMVQSDKGTEFLNSTFQSMLQRRGIKFYTSENEDLKASVVERFNRTLKTKMYRYFTHANTRRYLDVLNDFLQSYNNSHHRSIGMAPVEVGPHNEEEVRDRLYPLNRNRTGGSTTSVTGSASPFSDDRFARDILATGRKRFLRSSRVCPRLR